ncbi:MAG: M23 family metallopeptidase [Bacteroidetes bacterium]|nr:MAG: M23 family metallopeptidase [Bacteroidota bacterium]
MAKIKYYYDTEKCQYEPVKSKTSDYIFQMLGFLVVSFVLAIGITVVYNRWFPSDSYVALENEKKLLEKYYENLNEDLSFLKKALADVQDRDDNIYRGYFDSEPLPKHLRTNGTGGSDTYKDLPKIEIIAQTAKNIDQLKKQIYVQSKSLEDIVELAKKQKERVMASPNIMPIKDGQNRFISGFGSRFHPIFRVTKMHTGLDFTAPLGEPVYASGDGTVISAQRESGYGEQVQIDHGFGLITTYSHLSKFECRVGQKIKRGQIIGKVGNTGISVAPHLHYEVHKLNPKTKNYDRVDPKPYVIFSMTPKEYEEFLDKTASNLPSMGG